MESEDGLNLVVSFINGREKLFKIDDYQVDEDVGYFKLIRGRRTVGMIALNQISFWYMED